MWLRASLIAQFDSWAGRIHWRRARLPTPVFLGFSHGSADNESACNAGDLSSIPRLGRSPGEGKGYPLQYSGLENSMDCVVHGLQRVGHDWAIFTYTYKELRSHKPCSEAIKEKEKKWNRWTHWSTQTMKVHSGKNRQPREFCIYEGTGANG